MANTRKSAQSAQMEQMMMDIMEMLKGMNERISALEDAPKAQTQKAQPKAEKKKMVAYTNAKGETKMVSEDLARSWTAAKERYANRTDEQKAVAKQIADAKAREPELTRKLEKALGLKPNSLKNTACTADECRALGWKGTRKELKALKAQIRK